MLGASQPRLDEGKRTEAGFEPASCFTLRNEAGVFRRSAQRPSDDAADRPDRGRAPRDKDGDILVRMEIGTCLEVRHRRSPVTGEYSRSSPSRSLMTINPSPARLPLAWSKSGRTSKRSRTGVGPGLSGERFRDSPRRARPRPFQRFVPGPSADHRATGPWPSPVRRSRRLQQPS